MALELGQGHGSLCQRVQAPPPSYQASDKQDIIHSGPDLPWQDSSRVPVGEPVWIKRPPEAREAHAIAKSMDKDDGQ